jgi:D-alanyl-D-alanine carboxypeptidase
MLETVLDNLGIDREYARQRGLPVFAEAAELVDVGPNIVGHPQQLSPPAADAWQRMRDAASDAGVTLLLVSGYRSYAYQGSLIRRKLDAGQPLAEILSVNAPPGCSEHHTGRALDLATPGSRPLTEEFESTDAFAWLCENAERYGFSMTYPRENALGFIYEPWHWSLKPHRR